MFLCDKETTIPQIKFGFFLAFKQSVWTFSGLFLALFGFLLNFLSGNPATVLTMIKPSKHHRLAVPLLQSVPQLVVATIAFSVL